MYLKDQRSTLSLYEQLDYCMAAKLEIYNEAKFSLSRNLSGSIKQ